MLSCVASICQVPKFQHRRFGIQLSLSGTAGDDLASHNSEDGFNYLTAMSPVQLMSAKVHGKLLLCFNIIYLGTRARNVCQYGCRLGSAVTAVACQISHTPSEDTQTQQVHEHMSDSNHFCCQGGLLLSDNQGQLAASRGWAGSIRIWWHSISGTGT